MTTSFFVSTLSAQPKQCNPAEIYKKYRNTDFDRYTSTHGGNLFEIEFINRYNKQVRFYDSVIVADHHISPNQYTVDSIEKKFGPKTLNVGYALNIIEVFIKTNTGLDSTLYNIFMVHEPVTKAKGAIMVEKVPGKNEWLLIGIHPKQLVTLLPQAKRSLISSAMKVFTLP